MEGVGIEATDCRIKAENSRGGHAHPYAVVGELKSFQERARYLRAPNESAGRTYV